MRGSLSNAVEKCLLISERVVDRCVVGGEPFECEGDGRVNVERQPFPIPPGCSTVASDRKSVTPHAALMTALVIRNKLQLDSHLRSLGFQHASSSSG